MPIITAPTAPYIIRICDSRFDLNIKYMYLRKLPGLFFLFAVVVFCLFVCLFIFVFVTQSIKSTIVYKISRECWTINYVFVCMYRAPQSHPKKKRPQVQVLLTPFQGLPKLTQNSWIIRNPGFIPEEDRGLVR